MEAKANNRPGRARSVALSRQASSEVPDQKPYTQPADAHKRPASEAGVSLPVLFLIIIVVEIVKDPGPQKEVRQRAVPNAVPGAVHPRTRPLLTALCRGTLLSVRGGLANPRWLAKSSTTPATTAPLRLGDAGREQDRDE